MIRRLPAALSLALLAAALPGGAHAAVPNERSLYEDAPSGMYLLERGWTTRADPRDAGLRQGWQRPGRRAGFRRTTVPDAFNAGRLTSRGNRSRVQWYRLRFTRPSARGASGWKLRFESVNVGATVFLNGRRIGSHEGAHLPFELPAEGLRSGVNELVVRVDGRESKTDLPPAGRVRGWWNYGGLLREVYLRRVGRFDLADPQIVAKPGSPARLRAVVRNTTRTARKLELKLELTGPDGFALTRRVEQLRPVRAGRLARVETSFEIPNARLWSPADPALYEARLRLPGGQVTRVHFGVREWTRDADGTVRLNGRPLSLRGASFHEEAPRVGGALRAPQLDEIARSLSELGADFTRQHYPAHPRLLESFDRQGIVMWQQIPVWRLRDTQLRSRRLRREARSRLREMILRDRNHASLMTWSVGNEILRGGPGEEAYLRETRREIRRLDPTRFFGIDKSLSPLEDVPGHYRLLDVLGVSAYVGWYDDRASADLRPALDELRARFPGVGLFMTEFGAEANREGAESAKGTFAFQSRFLQDYLSVADSAPYLNGACIWILRDFAVRPGWEGGNPRPDPPFNHKGLIDEHGARKPAFDVVRQRFEAVPATR